ncbi:MAG: HD-GYP domain-containing protein [Planctomycetales bacterium]|nr:HD-GYP domain-containing protein [Planctomycetales bacterium]
MSSVVASNPTQHPRQLRLARRSARMSSRWDAKHSIEETLHAMISSIQARDRYTRGHSERVAKLSLDLAVIYELSHEACQEIYIAGIVHDIGKIGIPDCVLFKEGILADAEYKTIQKHPEIGYRILERLGHLQFVLPGVLYHHERWDGKGYPHRLAGQTIPIMARIMAVADAYDAMTSCRPYRQTMPVEKAQQIVVAGGGEQWDAEVVECFSVWLSRRKATKKENSPVSSLIPDHSVVEQIAKATKVVRR